MKSREELASLVFVAGKVVHSVGSVGRERLLSETTWRPSKTKRYGKMARYFSRSWLFRRVFYSPWSSWKHLRTCLKYVLLFYKEIDEEVLRMQTDEIVGRARLLDNEIKVKFFMSTLVTLWSYDILPKLSTIPKT